MRRKILVTCMACVTFILVFYLYMHRQRGPKTDPSRLVYINTLHDTPELFRNGKPFYIKGASGSSYIKELSEAGGNTLRLYDTLNLNVLLNEAERYDVAVIVDIPLPAYHKNHDFYKLSENTDQLKKTVQRFINRYKNHPAILIWNLGNELNYPLTMTKNNFINTFNELIDIIHEEDPDHPISTSVSGTSRGQTLGIHLHSPMLDMVGFNAFGNISKVEPLMKQIGYVTNPKPYYMTEWGIHGPWESPFSLWWAPVETSSSEKGEIYKDRYRTYIKNNSDCLGSLVFYWGYKHEGTISWFNIFDEEGRKSQAYYELKSAWTGEKTTTYLPRIDKIKLNDSLTKHLIVLPGSFLDADFETDRLLDSTFQVYWSMYKEGWGHQAWKEKSASNIIAHPDQKYLSNKLRIKVPLEEGPYRLFVSVYDNKGNFATTNSPFYVLSTE